MRRRQSNRRFDWVYRGYEYTEDGERQDFALPSYAGAEFTIATGVNAARGLVLYDSQAHQTQQMQHNTALAVWTSLPKAARAEGRQALIKAVDGELHVRPSAWAVGNLMLWAWAIIIAEQDPETGIMLLPPTWSLWDAGALLPFTDISIARNEKKILATGDFWKAFTTNNSSWSLRPRWSSNRGRLLRPEEGLFLYLEGAARSMSYSNLIVTPRMRTLVADES